MSQCSSSSAVFRGDHEDLLDHLLTACHEHKANKPLDSFGRDLVPFFAPGEVLLPLPTRKYASEESVGVTQGYKTRKGSPPQPLRGLKCHKPATTYNVYENGGSLSPISVGTPLFSSTASLQSLAPSPPSPACPAFFCSPKPEAIPLPTTSFLSRAAVCYGFSVSPSAA